MKSELFVRNTIRIKANASRVWEALTNPELTKQYMYGCEAVSDWKAGSPILWKGFLEGKEIIFVKGHIVNIKPGKLLQYTTFDPNGAYEDIPANYLTMTQELTEENGQTVLSISFGDFAAVADGEKRYNHTIADGDRVWQDLKKVVENAA